MAKGHGATEVTPLFLSTKYTLLYLRGSGLALVHGAVSLSHVAL